MRGPNGPLKVWELIKRNMDLFYFHGSVFQGLQLFVMFLLGWVGSLALERLGVIGPYGQLKIQGSDPKLYVSGHHLLMLQGILPCMCLWLPFLNVQLQFMACDTGGGSWQPMSRFRDSQNLISKAIPFWSPIQCRLSWVMRNMRLGSTSW